MDNIVAVANLTAQKIDENFIKKAAKIALEGENKKQSALSIVFVGEAKMRKLNKKYKGKNKVTDVLAFENNNFPNAPRGEARELGEVLICPKEISKNSKIYGSDFREELARILTHGILHLLGYEHEKSPKSAKIMEEKQEYYLSKILNT